MQRRYFRRCIASMILNNRSTGFLKKRYGRREDKAPNLSRDGDNAELMTLNEYLKSNFNPV
jgi:hypothetical protein